MDKKEAVSFLFTHGRGVYIKDRGGTSRDYLIHSNFIDMGTEGHVRWGDLPDVPLLGQW